MRIFLKKRAEAMIERLIELIRQANFAYLEFAQMHPFEKSITEFTADYLLENCVIVLPCKVGDTVYVIEPCTCYNNYSDFDKCHHRRTKATKWLEMVRVPKKHHTKCLKLFERPFRVEYLNKIGKTVFLTREEAEKALGKEKK